ncbi:uncharacterized protein LOC130793638 [Actinidia eriantha]|uniref:uncharacterized protein LOC130793638 n=1 Tax=Actinidia eriantha TaxID=165200 RepID=UPI00259008F1|nr:uncharacterized protein LOC130793638 [Actinidia eriantha]XP_057511420.1 uncharacterized protein LOC130793638 [Actinidia eriantha]XP_057511421.1 uncharacterized protein LOC130793638 [Actinidia eriantha]
MSKRAAKSSSRRFWTQREEFLMGCMTDLLNQDSKWKLDCGQFKGGFYGECEKKIICAFPGTDLRGNISREKDVKGMRNKTFPYYEAWLVLFGKDRATGDLAEGPADSVAAIETEQASKENLPESPVLQFSAADMESMSANGGTSSKCPSSSNAKSKKRGRSAEGISKGLAEMANAFGIMFENTNNRMAEIAHRIGYAHDLSQQRRQVNAELSQLPLDSNQRLRAASMIVQEAERIDLFFSLSQEEKVEWVFMLLSGYI